MAEEKTPIGRRRTPASKAGRSSSTASDEEHKKVKFEIGGDATPFFDDSEPLVKRASETRINSSIRSPPTESASSEDVRRLFVELFELHLPEPGTGGEAEWEETARWIKYEEDVEGADHRWGRPHVAFLTFHSLLQLRYCLQKGVLMLGAKANTYEEICQKIVEAMTKQFNIDDLRARAILSALGSKHRCMNESRHSLSFRSGLVSPGNSRSERSWSERSGRSQTAPDISHRGSTLSSPKVGSTLDRNDSAISVPSSKRARLWKGGERSGSIELMRILPPGAECAEVFVGQVSELRKVRFCMVRLAKGVNLPELLDAPIPVRFIFVIVGPQLPDVDYHEIGRSVATLMSNPLFNSVAYDAQTREQLLAGLDQFLDASLVIPSGEIEKKSLLSVDAIKKALRRRREVRQTKEAPSEPHVTCAVTPMKRYDPLKRTGVPFAGLISDVKHRYPQYCSDLKDAGHFQCLTSLIFMFFAAFAPAISFGGLLGDKVDNQMGLSEVLVAQCLCGVVWGLLACQPLVIVGATGPVVLFEQSFYTFCESYGIEFLVMRIWAGFWILLLSLLTVLLEGSFLVRYITRFTEDIFATLIACIFCYESLKFIVKTFIAHPVRNTDLYCAVNVINETTNGTSTAYSPSNKKTGQPDTALLSCVLLLATFVLAILLRQLRTSYFLGRTLRRAIGDFGVPIALVAVGLIDQLVLVHPYLELLQMPDRFSTTDPSRGWFISPMGINKPFPWWGGLAAAVPALLAYILLFVEVEITELLLSTKERGLKKGSGFHYDLVLIGALTVVCSLMGLPWMCAAAVQSLAHASSLTIMKRKAPGERPEVERVLEQRVTTIGVALLIGACSFLGTFLKRIPVATLFGIFLYLGVISMIGVQFLQRVVLLFMPQKHHPDVSYCKKVRLCRMHMYTVLQLLCLVVLWLIKSIQVTSLAFPFVLMVVALLRKLTMPRIFTPAELGALDGNGEDADTISKDSEDNSRDFYEEAVLPV